MNWFFVALIAPILFSVSNYIDKFLLSRYFKKGAVGALTIFSSAIGAFILPTIYLIQPSAVKINPTFAVIIISSGFLYIISLIPYLKALEKDDSSVVVPLFQLIPVFIYFLGYILLGETLSLRQILASLLVISGAFILSLEHKSGKIKKEVLGLMVLSCFLVSFNIVIFKVVAINEDFWTTSFWEYSGFALCGILLLVFIKSYRKQFFSMIRKSAGAVISINFFNEAINIVAKIIMNFAALFVPVVLVSVIGGLQPFFIFVFGILLSVFFPGFIKENLERKYLIQKLAAIIIMFAGTAILI
ncbi:MAG: hypothetical protein A2365_01570 [Candidatus Nealsonbacteria bacterium RIFOXYB1_FULL_40_15]|uniref:EamA domain-containing protein n=2 Tax=Candidatus Nealsoniibacteriota TaxID=1817911 RepID=A0A1G2EME9_9BACT|nr:MAG: hypothetical protein A2427_00110 [Candidatus Nealsonbacteria bacterium RIFOXYC1_FULL_40_7]OGZ27261.1 MAG: hypothetical protein A2365_01570 [Candidatus Nealsonbacteria bacterium RIFOXYB1_FULL_40_15]OGZ29956.1 MAG: hypothetical protein A2562_02815 [Candidatus Nealsonbacteria bacterium RIFOXYD1_FULL_39_11]